MANAGIPKDTMTLSTRARVSSEQREGKRRRQRAALRERAYNIPAIEEEGFEADDLIATYADVAAQAGARVTIVSSDKDLSRSMPFSACFAGWLPPAL